MKPGQKTIYYLAGESREALEKSPFLERLLQKDLEVIYFTDPIDEYTMQNLTEFESTSFRTVQGGSQVRRRRRQGEEAPEGAQGRVQGLHQVVEGRAPSEDVESVKVSNRLVTTPCSVVTSKYGWSANMERIMKAQALSDDSRASYMRGKKTLEINPRHPLIKTLRDRAAAEPEDESVKDLARALRDGDARERIHLRHPRRISRGDSSNSSGRTWACPTTPPSRRTTTSRRTRRPRREATEEEAPKDEL